MGGDLKYSAEVSSVGDERDAANTKISMGEERDAANTKTSTDSVSSHPDDEREGTQEKENQNNIFPHQSTRSTKSLASEISKSGLSSRKKEPSATKKRRFRITVVSSKKRREPERKQTLEEKIMSGQRLTEEDMEELLKQIREGGDIRHISKKQKNDSDALGMGVCVSNYFGENEEEKDRNNFGGCQPFDIQKTDFENYEIGRAHV